MKLKNEKLWNEHVEKNKGDAYSSCCIKVAKRVMELLEEDNAPLHAGYHPDIHTPNGLISKADDDVSAGGITGFMAGCIASMVSDCHERGEEFRKIWNNETQINKEGDKATKKGKTLNPALISIKM